MEKITFMNEMRDSFLHWEHVCKENYADMQRNFKV